MILEIFGQALAGVQLFFQLGVSDVSRDDNRSGQRQPGGDRMLAQRREDGRHRLVQVDPDDLFLQVLFTDVREVLRGIRFELFEEDPVFGDFAEDLPVGRAGNAQTDGAGRAMPGEADDPHVVGEIFAAELGADSGFGTEFQYLLFEVEVPKRPPQIVS